MRSRSAKTSALYRKWNPLRAAFLVEMGGRCAVCGAGGVPLDVHEILAGSHRMNAFVERCCWLALCRTCHDRIQGGPIPYQLAIKFRSDPEFFDLEKFCEVWGRPATAVTADEVLEALRSLVIGERLAA